MSDRHAEDRYDTEIDEFDIEGTLAFAEHLVNESSRLWIEAGLAQHQRLQKLFFPSGLSYDGEVLRTPLTCPFFNNFEGTSRQARRLVAHTVTSSNHRWDSNRIYAWLKEVAALRQAA